MLLALAQSLSLCVVHDGSFYINLGEDQDNVDDLMTMMIKNSGHLKRSYADSYNYPFMCQSLEK